MKVLLPYKLGSTSAKLLASALNIKRIRPVGSRYNPRRRGTIINWGCSDPETVYHHRYYINDPHAVKASTNKLTTFRLLEAEGVNIPEYTTNPEVVYGWLEDGDIVFGRGTLSGHAGQGIVVLKPEDRNIPVLPLYTKKVKRKAEYRVHVFRGRVIDFQQKKRKHGVEVDNEIRSHTRGWVFARTGVELPTCVGTEAIKAVAALGLDFGAVDICYSTDNEAVVLEINSAPGLENEGTTLRKYAEAFNGL